VGGVAGATLGPRWLDLVRVRHPLARGLAHGVASHGIGTARMLDETRLAGATAAVGMALGGAIVAVALPVVHEVRANVNGGIYGSGIGQAGGSVSTNDRIVDDYSTRTAGAAGSLASPTQRS